MLQLLINYGAIPKNEEADILAEICRKVPTHQLEAHLIFLLDMGFDINAGQSALRTVIQYNQEAIPILFRLGADTDQLPDTMILQILKTADSQLIQILMDAGLNFSRINRLPANHAMIDLTERLEAQGVDFVHYFRLMSG